MTSAKSHSERVVEGTAADAPRGQNTATVWVWIRRAAALVVVLAAVVVLLLQISQRSAVPTLEDWRRAAEHVREHRSPEDAFRVEPVWDSRPRVYLDTMPYLPAKQPTWFDTAGHSKIWLLAEKGREEDGRERLDGWKLASRTELDSVTLLELTAPPDDPTLWDAYSTLEAAVVRRKYADKEEVCGRWQKGEMARWHCPRRDPFLYVGRSLQVVTNDVHQCIWAMPIDAAGHLFVEFDDVPLGRTLSGHFGQTLDAVRSSRGAPVNFKVHVADTLRFSSQIGLHDEGFFPFTVDLTGHAEERGKIVFEIWSDLQVDRFFCFVARTIG